MKNPFRSLTPVFVVLALVASSSARAGLNVPYTVDGNTLHLWHFDDPILPGNATSNQTETDAVLSDSITLTNYGLGNSTTFVNSGGTEYPATSLPPFSNIFLTNISANSGLLDSLVILPDNGVSNANGDSDAMAAGPEAMAQTNFCNATTGAFTFEALVNPQGNIFSSSAGNGEWEIFSGDSAAGSRAWQFRLENGATPMLNFNFIAFYTGASTENFAVALPTTGPDALALNHWYHVAVTYTGYAPTNTDTPGVLTLYWTLLDPTRTKADVLLSATNSNPGALGAGLPYPAVGGSQRNTKGIGNAGTFQGMIDEVRVSAVARYATNLAFNSTVVGASPAFLQEPPASNFIGYGQTLTLDALVSGSPAPSLQWQQTNTSGGGWSNLTGQTNSDLVISDATFAAAGLYQLVASNNIENFSYVINSTIVNVTVGAAFSEVFDTGADANDVASTNLALTTDLHYTLSDSADALHPGPETTVWDMTQFPIAADGGTFANIDNVSQWIGPTGNAGGATYTSPQGSYTYRTHILADSVDTTQPYSVKGTWWVNATGANILLNGTALNIASPFTNEPLESAQFVITNGFVPGLNTLDFVVPCVNPNGSYPESALRVEISSALGQPLAAGPPRILTQPATNIVVTDTSVAPGATASFSVVATGRPPLTYQWFAAGIGPISGATDRTLAFTNPAAGDGGTFTVVISNATSSVTSTPAMLTIVETNQPPIAPNYTFSVYSNNTLTIDMSQLLLGAGNPNDVSLSITWDASTTNAPDGATLTQPQASGSILVYTPSPNYVGSDEFNYYITDTSGAQTTGEVLIQVASQALPTIEQPTLVGHNLILRATGATPGGAYVILGSSDITAPLSSWTLVASGNFDNTGAASVSLPVNGSSVAEFYSLELP